jgi:hypothetical protein
MRVNIRKNPKSKMKNGAIRLWSRHLFFKPKTFNRCVLDQMPFEQFQQINSPLKPT